MAKNKTTKAPEKVKMLNITLDVFENMCIAAAEDAGIPNENLFGLICDFSKFSNNDGRRDISFRVHYLFGENKGFYGSGATPEIAINTAIEDYKIKTGATRINPQIKYDPQPMIDLQLSDKIITVGAKFFNAINKKFTDLTKVSSLEVLTFINELVKQSI